MSVPSLRKFPYPYRAAFSFANDVDNTPSLGIFLELMKFLNTDSMTPLGKGLDLEVGSSFWFFNLTNTPQLSYYDGGSRINTRFASFCRALWKSGHLDMLHTYGDFDEGGFEREFAEHSINELEKYGAGIKVWINHGNRNNLQNLGRSEYQEGADPKSSAYHFDLLRSYGVRFIWSGRMTHVIGQNAEKTYNVRLANFAQKLLSKTKYRYLQESLFDFKNRLSMKIALQDASEVWDFVRFVNRFGREKTQDVCDLVKQTDPAVIKLLISNSGYLILYTHMCEGVLNLKDLPRKLINNFEFLAKVYREGRLLVATTSRLLQYNERHDNIVWQTDNKDGVERIEISPHINALGPKQKLSESMLQGITFYCDDPQKTAIFFDGKPIGIKKNPRDTTGRYSVTIPWRRLEYPYN